MCFVVVEHNTFCIILHGPGEVTVDTYSTEGLYSCHKGFSAPRFRCVFGTFSNTDTQFRTPWLLSLWFPASKKPAFHVSPRVFPPRRWALIPFDPRVSPRCRRRDLVMASRLRSLVSGGRLVVAVLGPRHLPGIARCWAHEAPEGGGGSGGRGWDGEKSLRTKPGEV